MGVLLFFFYGFIVFFVKLGSKMKMGFVIYLWGKDWDFFILIENCFKVKIFGVELWIEYVYVVMLDFF